MSGFADKIEHLKGQPLGRSAKASGEAKTW